MFEDNSPKNPYESINKLVTHSLPRLVLPTLSLSLELLNHFERLPELIRIVVLYQTPTNIEVHIAKKVFDHLLNL
jgi:hypothetical protein